MNYDALYRRRDAAARRIQARAATRTPRIQLPNAPHASSSNCDAPFCCIVRLPGGLYKGRKNFTRLRNAVHTIQAMAKGWYVRKKVQEQRNRADLEQRFQDVMHKHRERIQILEMEKRTIMKTAGGEIEDWELRRFRAAVRVQAHWRGLVQRRKFQQSPERVKREAAARRIQSAFKKILTARRSVQSMVGMSVATSTSSPPRGGPSLRASGASVLLGSPQLRVSPGVSTALSPGGLKLAGAPQAPIGRGADFMSAKRYKELENQVSGKVSAHVALSKHRGGARRADPRQSDAQLRELLQQYNATAELRISATHTRQQNLVVMDTLCAQLEQMQRLEELPADVKPQDFPRPARGSERMERASQAHALMLVEQRVGNKWWKHLKGLNTQAVQDALLAEDGERWQELDARWRRMWLQMEEQENRRPDVLQELAGPSGIGAAAVAAAKAEALLEAKKAEYAAAAGGGASPAARSAAPTFTSGAMYTKPL